MDKFYDVGQKWDSPPHSAAPEQICDVIMVLEKKTTLRMKDINDLKSALIKSTVVAKNTRKLTKLKCDPWVQLRCFSALFLLYHHTTKSLPLYNINQNSKTLSLLDPPAPHPKVQQIKCEKVCILS